MSPLDSDRSQLTQIAIDSDRSFHATLLTQSVWPLSCEICSPDAAFQIITVLSPDPEADHHGAVTRPRSKLGSVTVPWTQLTRSQDLSFTLASPDPLDTILQ
jgi:hypothetical protein